MPRSEPFRHQEYRSAHPTSTPHQLPPEPNPRVGSDQYRQLMAAVGAALRRAGVTAIYLAHGTFVGTDAFGLLRSLSRVCPGLGDSLHRLQKQVVDSLAQDAGNYTDEFAREFERALGGEGETPIPVRLFHWSSENHHIGRADGAVRLIETLASHQPAPGDRILLWGHSHGGNVFALATNLLGVDRAARARFFRAARTYYRWPLLRRVDVPVWSRVRSLLDRPSHPLTNVSLDIVTFGTPVRYGWHSQGYGKLLHFVNHRPAEELAEDRAPFPPTLEDLLQAQHGDSVQALGVAGTNIAPSLLDLRTWLADLRLNRLLQQGVRTSDLLGRLKQGVRAADEGDTMLVDYGPSSENVAQHLAGHAVYTRLKWLPFHAHYTARRFYGLESPEL